MLAFIVAHQAIEAAAVVAILDLVFALAPSVAANGILHWIYTTVKGISAPQAPRV